MTRSGDIGCNARVYVTIRHVQLQDSSGRCNLVQSTEQHTAAGVLHGHLKISIILNSYQDECAVLCCRFRASRLRFVQGRPVPLRSMPTSTGPTPGWHLSTPLGHVPQVAGPLSVLLMFQHMFALLLLTWFLHADHPETRRDEPDPFQVNSADQVHHMHARQQMLLATSSC